MSFRHDLRHIFPPTTHSQLRLYLRSRPSRRLISLQTKELSYKHNINIENLRLFQKGTTIGTCHIFHRQPHREMSFCCFPQPHRSAMQRWIRIGSSRNSEEALAATWRELDTAATDRRALSRSEKDWALDIMTKMDGRDWKHCDSDSRVGITAARVETGTSEDDITTHPPLVCLATKLRMVEIILWYCDTTTLRRRPAFAAPTSDISIPMCVCWVAWWANDNTVTGGWNISNKLYGPWHRPKNARDRERDGGTPVCDRPSLTPEP